MKNIKMIYQVNFQIDSRNKIIKLVLQIIINFKIVLQLLKINLSVIHKLMKISNNSILFKMILIKILNKIKQIK